MAKKPKETITNSTDAFTAVLFTIQDGKFHFRKQKDDKIGIFVDVLDDIENKIGEAYRLYTNGYAVRTVPYAGYVPDEQIEWIE